MLSENSQLLTNASTFFVRCHSNDIMITTSEIIVTEAIISVSLSIILFLPIIKS
jgi:hypothetical protein